MAKSPKTTVQIQTPEATNAIEPGGPTPEAAGTIEPGAPTPEAAGAIEPGGQTPEAAGAIEPGGQTPEAAGAIEPGGQTPEAAGAIEPGGQTPEATGTIEPGAPVPKTASAIEPGVPVPDGTTVPDANKVEEDMAKPTTTERAAVTFLGPYHRYSRGDTAVFDGAYAQELVDRNIAVWPKDAKRMLAAKTGSSEHDTDIG